MDLPVGQVELAAHIVSMSDQLHWWREVEPEASGTPGWGKRPTRVAAAVSGAATAAALISAGSTAGDCWAGLKRWASGLVDVIMITPAGVAYATRWYQTGA